jgi:hypothetical protein
MPNSKALELAQFARSVDVNDSTGTITFTSAAISGNGIVSTANGININANNGLIANTSGIFVNTQTGLSANSSGLFIGQDVGTTANVQFTKITATNTAITDLRDSSNRVFKVYDDAGNVVWG